jgi:xylose isomerase
MFVITDIKDIGTYLVAPYIIYHDVQPPADRFISTILGYGLTTGFLFRAVAGIFLIEPRPDRPVGQAASYPVHTVYVQLPLGYRL